MLVRALIDEGRRLKQPVYFFFADLVKCFDRLWLRDCLNDLHDCGMREREIGLLYKLNEKAYFKVDTPAGKTEEIAVEEIVKQGTKLVQNCVADQQEKLMKDWKSKK